MNRSVEAINGRIYQVMATIPYGLARSEAMRILVAEIEENGPRECVAYAYYALTDAYAVSGEPDRSLVAFAKLSRWWDLHPELFDSQDQVQAIRTYNLVINALRSYPSVPLTSITSALDELENRAALLGIGRRVWAIERFMWSNYLGASDRDEHFQAWQREPRDEASYPEAVENWVLAHYFLETDRIDEGIRIARLALDDRDGLGDRSNLLAKLQHVYLVAGRIEDARAAHIASVQHMTEGPARSFMARARASNIAFLARSHNVTRCLALLHAEQDLLSPTAGSPDARWSIFTTLGATTTLLTALGQGDTELNLTTSTARTVSELRDWLKAEVASLTEQFDKRNGTLEYSREASLAWATQPAKDKVDLSIRTTPQSVPRPRPVPTDLNGDASLSQLGSPEPPTPDRPRISLSRSPSELRELQNQAMRIASSDPSESAAQLVAIGTDYESQGFLIEAGHAFIAAARVAESTADPAGSVEGFQYGLALLTAGDAELMVRSRVARDLARAFVNWGKTDLALQALTTIASAFETARQNEGQRSVELEAELTELLDTRARVLATAGRNEEALALAVQSAEAFAGMSRWNDAAFSFLVAGRICRRIGLDHDRARWLLESAAEGFALAHNQIQQTAAIADLIELLHEMGLHEEAEGLSSQLTMQTDSGNTLPNTNSWSSE